MFSHEQHNQPHLLPAIGCCVCMRVLCSDSVFNCLPLTLSSSVRGGSVLCLSRPLLSLISLSVLLSFPVFLSQFPCPTLLCSLSLCLLLVNRGCSSGSSACFRRTCLLLSSLLFLSPLLCSSLLFFSFLFFSSVLSSFSSLLFSSLFCEKLAFSAGT